MYEGSPLSVKPDEAHRRMNGVGCGEGPRCQSAYGCSWRKAGEGFPQVCHIGVTNRQDPRVETAEEVRDAVLGAAGFIPAGRLGTTDACGFSPFGIDDEPEHGTVDTAQDTACAEIAARVRGSARAAARLGVSRDRSACGEAQDDAADH